MLFLEPSQATEHLVYSMDTDPKCYKDGSRKWQPTIVHEPRLQSRQIVEIHPTLVLEGSFSVAVRCDQIRSMPRSTFLFQPPVEVIHFTSARTLYSHQKTGGVTFGSLFDDLTRQKLKSEFMIVVIGRTVPAAKDVKAQAVERLYADQETMRPEVFDFNIARVWEGLPAVHEAEFERLEMLGREGTVTT